MFYRYRFWSSLFQPHLFWGQHEDTDIKGYKRRAFTLFLFVIAYFTLHSIVGLNTANFTILFAQNLMNEYIVTRYFALLVSILSGVIFFIFHYYFFSFFLYLLTDIKWIYVRRIQLFVLFVILVEKFILLIVFYLVGFATNLNFLSIAPIINAYWNEPFVIFTVNQLSISIVIATYIQFIFLSQNKDIEHPIILLFKIIFLHLFFAMIIGLLSATPFIEWIIKGVTTK